MTFQFNTIKQDITQRPMAHTRKKKNTYIVNISPISGAIHFALCKTTPLPIVIKNGQTMQNTTDWMTATHFPNPGAHHLVADYNMLQPLLGDIASTVVEYLDKETGKPVAYLYPTSLTVCEGFENNYESRLNNPTRKDLKFQIAKRQQLLEIAYQNTK